MQNITEFEIKVLRECAGQTQPDLCWGAAMSVAIESLRSAGLVTHGRRCVVTRKGEALLRQLDSGQPNV